MWIYTCVFQELCVGLSDIQPKNVKLCGLNTLEFSSDSYFSVERQFSYVRLADRDSSLNFR